MTPSQNQLKCIDSAAGANIFSTRKSRKRPTKKSGRTASTMHSRSQVRSMTTVPRVPSKVAFPVLAIIPQRTTSPERGSAMLAR